MAETRRAQLHGVLVIDKPPGMTSAAVVSRVKQALAAKRVGHTGTLDPMATGVLPVCLGEGTKIAGYLLAEDKSYEGAFTLGIETDTLDAEGQVTREAPEAASRVTEEALKAVMAEFLGRGQQVPPMYSALKHHGKRLYQLARSGAVIDREPRPIEIYHLALLKYEPPHAHFAMDCSKGTYVRSLIAEIGTRLGCGAHLTALRRTRAGQFAIDSAVALDQVTAGGEAWVRSRLISPSAALAHLPALVVPREYIAPISNGASLSWSQIAGDRALPEAGTVVRLVLDDPDSGETALLALATIHPPEPLGHMRYQRVFTYGLTNTSRSSNLTRATARQSPSRKTVPPS